MKNIKILLLLLLFGITSIGKSNFYEVPNIGKSYTIGTRFNFISTHNNRINRYESYLTDNQDQYNSIPLITQYPITSIKTNDEQSLICFNLVNNTCLLYSTVVLSENIFPLKEITFRAGYKLSGFLGENRSFFVLYEDTFDIFEFIDDQKHYSLPIQKNEEIASLRFSKSTNNFIYIQYSDNEAFIYNLYKSHQEGKTYTIQPKKIDIYPDKVIEANMIKQRYFVLQYEKFGITIIDLQENNTYDNVLFDNVNEILDIKMQYNRFVLARYTNNKIAVYDAKKQKSYTRQLDKQKTIETLGLLVNNPRFLCALYDTYEHIIFDLKTNQEYSIPLEKKEIKKIGIRKKRYFYVLCADHKLLLFDLQEQNKHTIQLQKQPETLAILEDRFLYIEYQKNDKIIVTFFDLHNPPKKYSCILKQTNVKKIGIRDNRHLIIRYSDGEEETITFNNQSYKKRKRKDQKENGPDIKKRKL